MDQTTVLTAKERPIRSYMESDAIVWRHQKPNYDLVDYKYLTEKAKSWKEDSLEKIVENLVKTWEMESSHKIRAEDWGTIDHEKFKIILNGNRSFSLEDNVAIGNYNILLADCLFYQQKTNDESHDEFRAVFKSGFAWELTELFSGPPTVTFSWRHWGEFAGSFHDTPSTGERIELVGMATVRVNEKLKVEQLEIWYDPHPMMAILAGVKGPCGNQCPVVSQRSYAKDAQ